MRKLYKYLILSVLLFAGFEGYSQVLILEDFNDGTAFPEGWSSPTLPAFVISSATACDGNSARGPLNSTSTAPELVFMSDLATGEDIIVSFDYKILQTSGTATSGNFGSFFIEYSIDDGKNWITYRTIDQTTHTSSTSCVTITDTIAAADVPAGSEFGWRVRGAHNTGDHYIYIDNFKAIEDVDCIRPINVEVLDTTFDSITLSWDDLNNPNAGEWQIAYCPEGIDPSNPSCFLQNMIVVTSNPYTITGLDDGTKYDIYVRSRCGSASNTSAWTGPLTAQTVAIGTDCDNPFEITGLPFNHTSNTEIYDNVYSGTPGASCTTAGGFLNGYDVVYKYTSPHDDIIQIDLGGALDGDVGVFVYESCSKIGTECFAGAITANGQAFGISDLHIDAGKTYYIVISTNGVDTYTPYTLNITGFDCASWTPPNGLANYEFYNQTLQDYTNTRIGVTPSIGGADIAWYSDAALTSQVLDLNVTLVDGDEFWATQTIMGCTSPALHVTFSEFSCNDLSITSVSAQSMICDEGTTILEAIAGTSNLVWYDQASGGEAIGVGATFETPVLTETTSFWVSEFFRGEGILKHQANPGPTSNDSYSTTAGLIFELYEPTVLLSTQVYVTGPAGDLVVELTDSKGSIQERTINVPGGSTTNPKAVKLNLDFELNDPTAGPFRLRKVSGPSMMATPSTQASFPYAIGNVGRVTSGVTTSNTPNYYYFYDWSVISSIALCESDRIEVQAIVNETKSIAINAVAFDVCVGGNADLTAISDDQDYVYTWTWLDKNGVLQTVQGANITPALDQETVFTVNAVNPNTGCSTERSISIGVVGVGDIAVSAERYEICSGEVIKLNAGTIVHDFEQSFITDWTFVNNSNPAGNLDRNRASWKQVSSPYLLADNASSNDGSKFMITMADNLGPGSTVDTEMISPPINLVGVQSASLEFHHFYKHLSTKATTARVLISDDAGLTWNQVASYSSTQGSESNFSKVTIDLHSYLGSANVQVKFHYTGGWGWWWAVDNVNISQVYANGEVTWMGSASQYLYLDDQASIPYIGQPTNVVYFKGEDTGVYDFEVDLYIEGCGAPITNTISVSVTKADVPTGATEQYFNAGARVFDLDVQGQQLMYYIKDANGELVRVSINAELVDGETYYVSQRVNGCDSDYLEILATITCPEPSNLTVTPEASINGASASAIVFWDQAQPANSIESYHLIVKDKNGVVLEDISVSKSRNYFIVENLEFEKEYSVELYSVCDVVNNITSASLEKEFDTYNLGVEDFDNLKLTFYPNPVDNYLNIESEITLSKIEVISIDGKVVEVFENINAQQTQLDLSNLSTGTYMLLTTGENNKKLIRIMKK